MKNDETDFIDVTLWGKTAEISAQHLTKGRFVNVQGRLKQDKWQDKDGNNRYSMSVVADNIYFGPKGSSGETQTAPAATEETSSEAVPF